MEDATSPDCKQNQLQQLPTNPKVWFFKNIFHHPNFNVIAGLFGIAGTILAVYFWHESIKEPNLTYYISPTRTPIVQKGSLDNFSVTFQGAQVTGDLSSAQIQIWNQGKAPIRKEDILKSVSIKMSDGEPIYQITAKPSRDVIGFHLVTTTNGPANSFKMDWDILEQNDGVQLQLIYGGGVNVPLIVDGVIVGQKELTQYKVENGVAVNAPLDRKILATFCYVLLMFALVGAIAYFMTVTKQRAKISVSALIALGVLLLLLILTGFSERLINTFIVTTTKPPFGF